MLKGFLEKEGNLIDKLTDTFAGDTGRALGEDWVMKDEQKGGNATITVYFSIDIPFENESYFFIPSTLEPYEFRYWEVKAAIAQVLNIFKYNGITLKSELTDNNDIIKYISLDNQNNLGIKIQNFGDYSGSNVYKNNQIEKCYVNIENTFKIFYKNNENIQKFAKFYHILGFSLAHELLHQLLIKSNFPNWKSNEGHIIDKEFGDNLNTDGYEINFFEDKLSIINRIHPSHLKHIKSFYKL